MMTVQHLLTVTIPYFERIGIARPRFEAETLFSASLGVDRIWLYTHYDQPLSEREVESLRKVVERRSNREPLQYIIGHWGFWSLDFAVSPGVLIPRQETECLVEWAASRIRPNDTVLDICTGSGNIVISLAREVPSASFWATDISPEAVEIAKGNAGRHSVADRVRLMHGDLFSPFSEQPKVFELILCNPPYIPSGEIDGLQKEIRAFEPRIALDGGVDGLAFYRRLIPESLPFIRPSGYLVLEIGHDQADPVHELLSGNGFEGIEVHRDYAGLERMVTARLPKGRNKEKI